ncbi:hypothetical protein [Streptomyces sp. NPDC058398]|uniref:hypothetical protein n=1 Tax=Streptomyces sp. NPDC058398 TaxID=3346479 RepID=UPI00365D6887
MDRYPPIADHGLVGDLQCSALVSAKGVVDWFAAPGPSTVNTAAALSPAFRVPRSTAVCGWPATGAGRRTPRGGPGRGTPSWSR